MFTEFLGKLELFSRTADNRFVFSLFDLLLCGVIVWVIVRGWRAHARVYETKNQFFLFLAFSYLGASFALDAIFAGAIFFYRSHLPEASTELFIRLFQVSAWLLLLASAFYRPVRSQAQPRAPHHHLAPGSLLFAPLGWPLVAVLPAQIIAAFDLTNLVLLALAALLFYRRPLGGRQLATGAVGWLFLAGFLHLSQYVALEQKAALILWNLEQCAWSFSLFTFALAIGETSRDLFDRVFVRLQVAFILLASVMILVITQTEKTEYLTSIRSHSYQLAEFVRGNVDYLRQQNESLSAVIEREDFLQRAMLGFGNLPELKIVRIVTDSQSATLEVADNGEIHSELKPHLLTHPPARMDSEEYFLIHELPLAVDKVGEVEFYGTREFLDQHIRKRIILIFSLFTGMVALSTLMIGLVVRGASATIGRQSREIEEAQQRLLQTSKLAAIGELAAGVAHEINNPATSILGLTSFWLAQGDAETLTCPREDLKDVMSQAQSIAQITGALLTFSHRQTLDIKPVPLDRVIASGLRIVDDLLISNQVAVELDLQPNLPRVLADEDNLVRAMVNLYRNAIDAMPGGGTLRIGARQENAPGKEVRLEIADTGSGIPPEHLARIFDPFFTTKEIGKGTGLGLSIVHGIIKEHQGTFAVESPPGKGTKFTITLRREES
jgi:signal transduction histidine kinase